ncbi:FecCD family ABC transporter permease [Chitinivibrio alkaliphilus]|uniref:ABC transporter, permease component n=1 Tax=Chitinivibrio alkaliphilus ACht1 TaxID=1313304 RepID=U7DB72_9BACT|nr:iron ABC transporter permease [Chitinivibrio alkaliphilus]ERP31670.1 ABC transporter, permease component [Chitinivibrio alkaliphilus ACht1]
MCHSNQKTPSVGDTYESFIRKKRVVLLMGVALLALVAIASCGVGSVQIGLMNILTGNLTPAQERILLYSRLPRVITAIFAGMALSLSGAAMQSILRNPLGSPFTLGISHAAAFGAALSVLVLGNFVQAASSKGVMQWIAPYIITISAFGGAMIATAVILFVSKVKRASPEVIVLTGVAISSLFTAGTSFMQYFADDTELGAIVFWTFGDVGRSSWYELVAIIVITCLSLVFFWWNRWNFNALESGDETAKSLGVSVERVRLTGMLMASLLTAVVISFLGIIGFVGLVCPHISRRLIGEDYRHLIPFSCLAGALLLILADTVARTILAPHVIPVAIITSFLGAPVFIYLLVRRNSGFTG